MSAINEWFGYYNAIFKYIRDTYGEGELDEYFKHLSRVAYSDVTAGYREGGLEAIAERYVSNFKKDGDGDSASAEIKDGELTITVKCPAFTHGVETKSPYRRVDSELCHRVDHHGQSLNGTVHVKVTYKIIIDRKRECEKQRR